jgi:IrrE N-terminal-like domain
VKSRDNRYLKRISSLVGERDLRRAVEIFVNRQRTAGESLEVLAWKLGIDEIVEEALPFEGGLFRTKGVGLTIKLNSHSPTTRKRFTLAHELGHLLLGTVPGFRNNSCSDAALERACDSIAAELLMPTQEIANFVGGLGSPSPEQVKMIASRFAVSLWSASIRIHDLALWNCCIGFWERHPKIRTVWFVGRRQWDTVEPQSDSLDLALSSKVSVRTTEFWPQGPGTGKVALNLIRIGVDRVFGLVEFIDSKTH